MSHFVDPLPPLVPNVMSVTSVSNDKGDNDIQGTGHRSPGIYLIADENPGKPQLGDHRLRLCNKQSPKMGYLASK